MTQEARRHGSDLLHSKDRAVGELDLVVRSRNRAAPIEVESGKGYARRSALSKALATGNHGIERAIVPHEGNVERRGAVGTCRRT